MHSSSFSVHPLLILSIMRSNSTFFIAFSLIHMLSPAQPFKLYPTANLSTTWTFNASYGQPVLRRETNIAVFTFGFLCEGDCTFNGFGIFISPNTKSPRQFKCVWSPLREYGLLSKNATLKLTAAGDLVLVDGDEVDGFLFWSTRTAGKAVAGMNLTDTGNLVLFNDQNSIVWQSFDHPIDSLLPGQKCQKLISNWAEYTYTLEVTDKGVFGYTESQLRSPETYFSLLIYSNDTNIGRRYMRFLKGSLSLFIDSSDPIDPYYVIDIPETSSAQYMKLMPDGYLKVFEWQSEEWTVIIDLTTVLQSNSYTANISTEWDASYSHVQPMLLRNANYGAQFACGFLCEGKCTDGMSSHYIFSIFIKGTSRPEDYKVVWSANRDHPVGNDAILYFTSAGELVLMEDGSIVWTTNTAGKSVIGMNLSDTGNLVLFNDQNFVVWQSFDHPTDSLLPGQRFFQGQKLKSGVSSDNSSQGMFSLQVTDEGVVAYVESNPPQVYSTMSVISYSNDKYKGRRYIRFLNLSLSAFIGSSKPNDPNYIPKASSTQYMKLMPDGHLQVFEWKLNQWAMVADLLNIEMCDYPLTCGKKSICSTKQQCSCPTGAHFRPVNDREPNLGCLEVTPLTCSSTQDPYFILLENVTYFTSTSDMNGVILETCKLACLNNCSCKAAIFQYYPGMSSGKCFLPSELFTMKSVDPNTIRAVAFIKVQNARSHRVAKIVGSTVGSFVLLLVVGIGFTVYIVHKRKRDAETEEEYLDQMPGMPTRFPYEELRIATENFSKKLGKGGFGSVFEGTLGDGTKIAVKCLKGLSHVKKSFLAEVQSIGSIHHVNLVRLRGFCAWKSQRLLVYDFMSNGSLDCWIYHGVRERILKWEWRKKIILDIAKGLAYLHEECRQKIVHLDIKPQNILLDINLNAKVSDFGLSKLIDKTETGVKTTIKGTPGYIAPEWRRSTITINEKVDVYSFGIVLLEILCGRKIFDRSQTEENWHLLFVFERCWEQGTLLDMVDTYSVDMQVHRTKVVEMMKLAAWCLQTNFKRRPSMSSVVKVLEGGMNVESNLDYNFTDPRIQEITVEDEKDFTRLSPSLLSGPR